MKEHEEFKELFKKFEETGKRASKQKHMLIEELVKELKAHEQIEEQIFYPAVQKKASKEIQELILEGIEEHRVADFVVARIQQSQPEDDLFDARVKVLMESVKHHMREEEKQVFPEAREKLGDDLERLGAEMEELHQKLE
jgi:iron-sulfur cluster repair protein YtfE (RIC family)